jgi:hypothetical protein
MTNVHYVSSVNIATRYGLDGPVMEFRLGVGGARFSAPVQTGPWGPTQPPLQWVPGLPREVKWPERGVDHPPPSSAEVEGRIELYIHSLSLGLRGLL